MILAKKLVNAAFQPAGWFKGHIWLWKKNCARQTNWFEEHLGVLSFGNKMANFINQKADVKITFSLWLPWTSRDNSDDYKAIYYKIVEKIHANKKELRENGTKNTLY